MDETNLLPNKGTILSQASDSFVIDFSNNGS